MRERKKNQLGQVSVMGRFRNGRASALTPALSRRERENGCQPLKDGCSGRLPSRADFIGAFNHCFPLPAGEGSRVREKISNEPEAPIRFGLTVQNFS
jgi:hypothetical protein